MSDSKKRAASSDGAAQVKKPKFEKKSFPKKNTEHQNRKNGNPFTGKNSKIKENTFYSLFATFSYFVCNFNPLNQAVQIRVESLRENSPMEKLVNSKSQQMQQANSSKQKVLQRKTRHRHQPPKKLTGRSLNKRKKILNSNGRPQKSVLIKLVKQNRFMNDLNGKKRPFLSPKTNYILSHLLFSNRLQ